jgi:hypothetical protein
MALIKLLIDTGSGGFSELDGLQSLKEEMPKLINYLQAVNSGAKSAELELKVNSLKKTTTMTVSASGQQEDESFVICGEEFTLKDNLGGAGATGMLVEISESVNTMAANIKKGIDLNINSKLGLKGVVGAVSVAANVVTVQAAEGGLVGNGIVITENITNLAVAQGVTGVDGSSFVLSKK